MVFVVFYTDCRAVEADEGKYRVRGTKNIALLLIFYRSGKFGKCRIRGGFTGCTE